MEPVGLDTSTPSQPKAETGLPSIATAVGGIPEVLVDGENGLLVPLGDQGALARGLARLLDDQSMAERLGAAAAATVRSRFSWKKNVADYEALCEELATATCRRPWT